MSSHQVEERLKGGPRRPIDWHPRGRLLPEPARSHLEALLGYDLQDVRVHDYHQAELAAERLRAEAFAIGHHVFGSRQSLEWSRPGGLALLAHELRHVVQQTAPPPVARRPRTAAEPPGNSPESRPLPSLPRAATADSSRRPPVTAPRPPRAPHLALARRGDPEGAGSLADGEDEIEAEALATEGAVREAAEPAKQERRQRQQEAPPDAHAVAGQVYRLMCREMKLLRERGARP